MRTTKLANNVVQARPEKVERRWASIAEVALYAGVSSKTVQRWIANGVLGAYRAGPKLVKIDLAEVDNAFTPIPAAGGRAA